MTHQIEGVHNCPEFYERFQTFIRHVSPNNPDEICIKLSEPNHKQDLQTKKSEKGLHAHTCNWSRKPQEPAELDRRNSTTGHKALGECSAFRWHFREKFPPHSFWSRFSQMKTRKMKSALNQIWLKQACFACLNNPRFSTASPEPCIAAILNIGVNLWQLKSFETSQSNHQIMQTIANDHCRRHQKHIYHTQCHKIEGRFSRCWLIRHVKIDCSHNRTVQRSEIRFVYSITTMARADVWCISGTSKSVTNSWLRCTSLLHNKQATKKSAEHGQISFIFRREGLRISNCWGASHQFDAISHLPIVPFSLKQIFGQDIKKIPKACLRVYRSYVRVTDFQAASKHLKQRLSTVKRCR